MAYILWTIAGIVSIVVILFVVEMVRMSQREAAKKKLKFIPGKPKHHFEQYLADYFAYLN